MTDPDAVPTIRATQTVDIPPPAMPPQHRLGIYANQISQIGSEIETILDFSVAAPLTYSLDEENNLGVEVHHEIVSRIIVPKAIFVDFVRTFILRNPEAIGMTLIEGTDNEVGPESAKEGE